MFHVRAPLVVPPPTPARTGMLDAVIIALMIAVCGVNGYTAITASAFILHMIAISVVATILFIVFPNILIPLHSFIHSGTLII